jgi:hypothetical protein
LHSVWAFWEWGTDEGFAAQAEADFEGLAMDFGFGAEGLTDVAQAAASSAGHEVLASVEFLWASTAEAAQEKGARTVPVHLAAAAKGRMNPSKTDTKPVAVGGEFDPDWVSIGFEAKEPWVVGRWDRDGLLAEQAGIVQFADIDGARMEVLDEANCFTFLAHFVLHSAMFYIDCELEQHSDGLR